MSYIIPNYEPEPQEAFEWHHEDLFENPPYSHKDMVYLLAGGHFNIEGSASDESDAELFCYKHSDRADVWQAMREVSEDRIAINGEVF